MGPAAKSGQQYRRKYQEDWTKVSMVSVSRRASSPHCGTGHIHEVFHHGQGVPPLPGKSRILGEDYRQVLFGHRHHAAQIAVDHRDRVAPVALAGDAPVAEAEIDRLLAHSFLLQEIGDRFLGTAALHAVEPAGIHHDTFGGEGRLHGGRVQAFPFRLDHHLEGQTVFPGELEVPLVMGRHRHDRPGAVIRQDEVGQVDRACGDW